MTLARVSHLPSCSGGKKNKELAVLSLVLGANSLIIPFLYFEEKKKKQSIKFHFE